MEFYKIATAKYAADWLEKINKFYLWLPKQCRRKNRGGFCLEIEAAYYFSQSLRGIPD
jgi:hypothetical protein